VYTTPPPPDAGPGIKYVRLADIGAVPLLERATALSNLILRQAAKLGL
jgi:hypothetical protein